MSQLLCRYVDMIANPEVANIFRQRAKVGDLFLTFFYGGIFKIIYP